nr:putative reverse transcriptase domain-containing protein [Tanacetum cinerariifolium]
DESSDSDSEPEAGVELEVEEAGVEPEVEEAGDKPEAEGADVELEAEEPDGAPEATMGSGGLAPWALRRDLEALRRKEMIKEAESETSRNEITFLGSKAKIGKMERFYLEMVRKGMVPKPPSDDEGFECPRKMPKKSNEDKGPSDPRGPLIGAGGPGGASGSGGAGGSGGNADGTGVRGTGPTVPELTGCTYATFIKCDPLPFIGTEGAVGLCQWFERLESVFQISECKEKDRVKFAMATLRGRALTWWNRRTKAMGIEAANNTPWTYYHKWCSSPGYQLAGQLIQDKADEATEGEKRKGKSDRGGRGDN